MKWNGMNGFPNKRSEIKEIKNLQVNKFFSTKEGRKRFTKKWKLNYLHGPKLHFISLFC